MGNISSTMKKILQSGKQVSMDKKLPELNVVTDEMGLFINSLAN